MQVIKIKPLDEKSFAPYGDVIDFNRKPDFAINNGKCDRFHDLAQVSILGDDAKLGISLGRGRPYSLPLELKMMERHPLGSQAFIPLDKKPFLLIVAADKDGAPDVPIAFMAEEGQGVNYHRNTWHAVLTPLDELGDFVIVDRIGEGNNLEEYFFDTPYLIKNR
ncbi:ureidoglycolate lyase [Lentilitoribacter sp. Alg239-R112]|uniref:ureidoglycolate lyase n=1 Tax=Lentilitoribacter sp. Alg239-R112 TaxID=2305987 RepID=UPI0013A6F9C3|nr:ureidoglycolate lyase [Lentilitoribacter sp. Alg239-R112]